MTMTDELLDELRDLAEAPFDATCCNSGFPINQLRRVLGEAIAALSGRGEAVCWADPDDLAEQRHAIMATANKWEHPGSRYKQPLYTHPAPAAMDGVAGLDFAPSGQRTALGDMGEGTRLCIFKQEDGDLIVSVIDAGDRFSPVSVEFCIPGTGGSQNPALYHALSRAHAALAAMAKESQP